ncbi:MAG: GIY-YIG nuclease family protein [Spirochaeta sp.]|nr:GIY-YIG nuclease family protein [Spirochaeta sp.]
MEGSPPPRHADLPRYWVYFLQVRDGALYCGVTSNLERRFRQHASGRLGARYTKSRRPVVMVGCWFVASGRGTAQRVESLLKSLTRQQKLHLVDNPELIYPFCSKILPKDDIPVPDLQALSQTSSLSS